MVDRAGRRWSPNFIPDHSKIKNWYTPWLFESRWNSLKVHIYEKNTTYLKIEWLDINFSLEEWMRMANQINWTKDYINRKPNNRWKFFYWSSSWALFVNDSTWKSAGLNDTDILRIETMMIYYPKMLEDSNKNKILSYLNSL